MNKNKDTIAKLRLSNKKLHQELAVAKGQAGDEEVILSAFNATSRNEVSLVRSGILSQVRYNSHNNIADFTRKCFCRDISSSAAT